MNVALALFGGRGIGRYRYYLLADPKSVRDLPDLQTDLACRRGLCRQPETFRKGEREEGSRIRRFNAIIFPRHIVA